MKKTVYLFSIFSLIINCNPAPEEYVPKEDSKDYIYTFAIYNDYLYASSLSKLNIYSLSDPQNPIKVKEADIYGTRNLRILGSDLYLPQSATDVYSLATTPEDPIHKSFINAGECDLITANNMYAFTVAKANSICTPTLKDDHVAIFDLINPPAGIPIQNGKLGKINSIVLYGNYLITSGEQGLTIYDVTNPTAMYSVKTIANVSAKDLIINGDQLYAFTNSTVQQFSIDPSNIQNIQLISTYTL